MDNPLEIDFDRIYRLAICRPVGVFGAEHLRQLLNFLLAWETSGPPVFNRLLDLTRVTKVRLGSGAIYEYARARREATAHLPPFRTAIVAADQSTAEDLALVYATLMESSKIQVGIFRDMTSAAHWLCVPEAVISPKSQSKNKVPARMLCANEGRSSG
jgi:hypothetical protein